MSDHGRPSVRVVAVTTEMRDAVKRVVDEWDAGGADFCMEEERDKLSVLVTYWDAGALDTRPGPDDPYPRLRAAVDGLAAQLNEKAPGPKAEG